MTSPLSEEEFGRITDTTLAGFIHAPDKGLPGIPVYACDYCAALLTREGAFLHQPRVHP